MSTFSQGFELGMGLGGILMGFIATHAGFPVMYLCGSVCVAIALTVFLLGKRYWPAGPTLETTQMA